MSFWKMIECKQFQVLKKRNETFPNVSTPFWTGNSRVSSYATRVPSAKESSRALWHSTTDPVWKERKRNSLGTTQTRWNNNKVFFPPPGACYCRAGRNFTSWCVRARNGVCTASAETVSNDKQSKSKTNTGRKKKWNKISEAPWLLTSGSITLAMLAVRGL